MTLGQELRERRIEIGRSLEQISAATKIHLKILQAIEEDRYADLPARAFTRGFIVNYAKALKLDPNELLERHREFLEQKFPERADRDQGHQGYVFEGKELEQNRRWTWIGLSVAGVFAIAVVLIFKPGNHTRKEKHKEFQPVAAPSPVEATDATPAELTSSSPSPSATVSPDPTATPVATPTPEPSPSPTATPDMLNKGDDLSSADAKIKIILQAENDSWIRYRSDDKPIGVLILRKGRSIAIKAKGRVLFESSPSGKFRYKKGSGPFQPLETNRFEISAGGSPAAYSGSELGSKPLSDEVPAPKEQLKEQSKEQTNDHQ